MRQDDLLAGERVLWEGKPSQGIVIRPIEIALIPFSLLWAGFALFWNVSVWRDGAPTEFRLFGIPFLIAGLYVTIGRFVLDVCLRRRTRYVVTDQRLLFLKAGRSARSLDLKRLPVLELEERTDGSGTIRFEPAPNLFGGSGFGIWSPALGATGQFIRIPDARNVYLLIRQHANAD